MSAVASEPWRAGYGRNGAWAIGLDPQEALRPRVVATGEALPLADACMDIVLFFNSLHHVPVEAQSTALAEAARVVVPGGNVVVVEPLARGGHFETIRPLDDETEIRAHAHAAIRSHTPAELTHEREIRL